MPIQPFITYSAELQSAFLLNATIVIFIEVKAVYGLLAIPFNR